MGHNFDNTRLSIYGTSRSGAPLEGWRDGNTLADRRKALLALVTLANDPEDALYLMDMLGLEADDARLVWIQP